MSGPLHVVCPKCGKSGDVPAEFAGRDIHCKKCDAHFIVPGAGEAHAHAHAHAAARVDAHAQAPAHSEPPEPAPPPPGGSLLDSLSDDAPLAPLTDEEEKHARDRYEARVLSKDRVAHYDDHGNLLSEAEYEERLRQGRGSVH